MYLKEADAEKQKIPFAKLTQLAAQAPAFGPIVDVDDHRFLGLGDMPDKIRAYCQETGQRVPEGKGAILRCANRPRCSRRYSARCLRSERLAGEIPAHIAAGKLVSSESFTWLREHFNTALADIKPEIT